MLWASLVTNLFGGVNVDLFQPLGSVDQSAKVHVRVAVFGCPDHAFRAAGAGEPDVRPGILHGLDPWVYHPVLEILALVAEWAVVGPALDDQVVGFLESGEVLCRILPGQQRLDGGTTHETGDYPASRIAVQHGDLFGHADGVSHRDDVAQDSDLDVLG